MLSPRAIIGRVEALWAIPLTWELTSKATTCTSKDAHQEDDKEITNVESKDHCILASFPSTHQEFGYFKFTVPYIAIL